MAEVCAEKNNRYHSIMRQIKAAVHPDIGGDVAKSQRVNDACDAVTADMNGLREISMHYKREHQSVNSELQTARHLHKMCLSMQSQLVGMQSQITDHDTKEGTIRKHWRQKMASDTVEWQEYVDCWKDWGRRQESEAVWWKDWAQRKESEAVWWKDWALRKESEAEWWNADSEPPVKKSRGG